MEINHFTYNPHSMVMDNAGSYNPPKHYSHNKPTYNNDGTFLAQQPPLNKDTQKEIDHALNQTYKVSGQLELQAQRQRISSQNTFINQSNKNLNILSEGRHKTRYSFKRATSAKPEIPRLTLPAGGYLTNRLNSKDELIQNRSIITEKQHTTNSFSLSKIQQLETRLKEQEFLLTRIRDIAYSRKIECQKNLDKDYACISALIQIYNITIFNTTLAPLPSIKVNVNPASKIINNVQTSYISNPINIVIANTPVKPKINVLPAPVSPFYRPPSIVIPSPHLVTPSRPQSKPIVVPPQPVPAIQPKQMILPHPPILPITHTNPDPVVVGAKSEVVEPKPVPAKVPEFVDKSEQYLKQIKELKIKISELQSQRLNLFDQIRHYQRQRYEASKSDQMITYLKSEIERLNQQISILSVPVIPQPPIYIKDETQIEQLKQKLAIYISRQHEYEQQLIEAQNHIIYLQNQSKQIPPCSHEKYDMEIASLRETIAHYNEYIQNIEAEKQEFRRYVDLKQEEIHKLYEQINDLNVYIQQSKHNNTPNGVDPNQYYNLAMEYGKKSFQVIILFSEIERLQKQCAQIKGYLMKAEEYIVNIQQQYSNTEIKDNSQELQLALEQQLTKQSEMKSTYENEIHRLNVIIDQLSQQVTFYEGEINAYKIEISNVNITIGEIKQQITVYQSEIHLLRVQVERITNINIQLTQQISIYQSEINAYATQLDAIAQPNAIQGIDPEIYSALMVDLGKKELQVIILLEEINRLNVLRNEVLDHLKRAEDYIVGAQEYIRQLENKLNSHNNLNGNQIERYKLQITELQSRLILLTQKIAIYESNQASHLRQIQTLQLKHKQLLATSDRKYEEWSIQKRSLVSQISLLTTRIAKITNANTSIQKSLQLHEINKQLNIQIAEITQLLVNSQAYIRGNAQKWERVLVIERQLGEQSSLIEVLNREVQLTKTQNTMLNERIIELQRVIQVLNTATTITTDQSVSVVMGRKEEREIFVGNQQIISDNAKMNLQVVDGADRDNRHIIEIKSQYISELLD